MDYQVPRYIDAEPTILGPLTFKNVITILIVGAVLAVFYFILQPVQFAFLAVPIVGATVALMFVKANGRPLISYVQALFQFALKPQIFIWKRNAAVEHEGVEHIFHIYTEEQGEHRELLAGLTGPKSSDAPKNFDEARRQKLNEIAHALDETFTA